MQSFRNLKISVKLIGSFVLLGLVAAGIGWVGLSGSDTMAERSSYMYSNSVVPLVELTAANRALQEMRLESRNLLIARDAEERREIVRKIQEHTKTMNDHLTAYKKTSLEKQEVETLARFAEELKVFENHRDKAVELGMKGQQKESYEILQGPGLAASAKVRKTLAELIEYNAKIAEEKASENDYLAATTHRTIMIAVGLGLLGALALGFFLSKAIGGPITKLSHAADRLALGDTNVELPTSDSKDELGMLSASFRAMVGSIREQTDAACQVAEGNLDLHLTPKSERDELSKSIIRMVETLRALVAESNRLTKAAIEGTLAERGNLDGFHGGFRKIVEGVNKTLDIVIEPLRVASQQALTLSAAAEEMTAVSQQLAGAAEETAAQAGVVSASSEQVSKNVTTVASSSEEMQASIREISKSAHESAKVAQDAVVVADRTNSTIMKLGESSQEIGEVIKVIKSIAQQTNLLALNATIEAARAGDTGKGFAVVANEVKELAGQTAKATQDISHRIEAIQADTKGAVQAIGGISSVINQVRDISTTIASAVEEQTATTREIAHNVNEAAQGTGEIAKSITGVAVSARDTTQAATQTKNAAIQLSQLASQLQSLVGKFTF